jgi:dipeptidyl aminopeptidase/acylaminoacyl peptidase
VDVPLVGPPPGPPPAPAGQGKLILQTESGGAFYLVNADGTNLRYIASGIDPAFSPDGAKIAFTRWGSGEIGSVWVYDLASGTEAHILGEMFEPKAPTWSPDGTKLVINYQHGGRRYIEAHCLDFIDVLTGRRRIPDNAYDINVGSESSRICFKLPADTHWQLRSIDVATGNFDDLASDTYSYAPTWDPVNSWRIIFAGSTGLQQLDLNRNEYWPFTTDVRDYAPVISPDGSKVAVSYRQHDHWEIYTISTADGARARLTKSEPFIGEPFNSASPAWSPNSQKIAFVTDRSGQWEFWVMNADGSDPRPLLPPEVAAQLTIEYHGVHERLISWSK